MSHWPTVPAPEQPGFDEAERLARVEAFADRMARRRTVREYSDREVSQAVIDAAIRAAGAAPSGANTQPWHFVVVREPALKTRIREAAEREEREFYHRRAPQAWLDALAPLGTNEHKPFLEVAPVLIAVFYERYGIDAGGERYKTYYSTESVGLATGLLIAALHEAGLSTLTHTPSPMKFLREILDRPVNESPYLLLVTGHAAEGARVPDVSRKPLEQIRTLR